MKEIKTIPDLYLNVIQKYSNPKALNIPVDGKWEHISTADFLKRVRYIALGLRSLGIKRGDCIGLMGPSSQIGRAHV